MSCARGASCRRGSWPSSSTRRPRTTKQSLGPASAAASATTSRRCSKRSARLGAGCDALADDSGGAAGLHGDAVEDVARFHRALLMGHHQQLGLFAELVHEVDEAMEVDVV